MQTIFKHLSIDYIKHLPLWSLGRNVLPEIASAANDVGSSKEEKTPPYGSCWVLPDGAPPAALPRLMGQHQATRVELAAEISRQVDDEKSFIHGSMHSAYGKRVEIDGTWTVYHVFSGVPAEINGRMLDGMSAAEATEYVLRANAGNAKRRLGLSV